jgi:MFS family permease
LSTAHPHRSGGLFLVLGAVTGVQAIATLAVLAMATVAPSAAPALGIGAEFVGYQISLTYVAAAIVSAIAGTVVRRWGAGSVSQTALALAVVGTLGLASGSIVLAAAATLLIGAGYGLTNPAASHLLFRHTAPRERNLIFSIKQTGVPIGGIVAGLTLPILTEGFGWQFAVMTCSMLALVAFVLFLPMRKPWDAGKSPGLPFRSSVLSGLSLVWSRPEMRRLGLTGTFFAATQLSLMTFTVTFLVTDLDWSLVLAGTVAATVQVTGAVARIGWGAIADKTGNGMRILVLTGLLSSAAAAATAMLDLATPPWIVIAVLSLFGASSIGWNGVFLAEVARLSGSDDVSAATGGALLFTFAGVVIGPTLYASIYQLVGGYGSTFGVFALLPLMGILSIVRLTKRDNE